jgi:hypothetical protein
MAGRNPAEGVRGGRGRAWGEGLSRRIPRLHLYCINSIDGARSLNWWLVISEPSPFAWMKTCTSVSTSLAERANRPLQLHRKRGPALPGATRSQRYCAHVPAAFCCSGGAPLSGLVQSPDSRKQRSRSVGRSSSTICGRPAARPGGGGGVEIRRSRPALVGDGDAGGRSPFSMGSMIDSTTILTSVQPLSPRI